MLDIYTQILTNNPDSSYEKDGVDTWATHENYLAAYAVWKPVTFDKDRVNDILVKISVSEKGGEGEIYKAVIDDSQVRTN